MNKFKLKLLESLKNTFKIYIRHDIEHSLSEQNPTNILQAVINLQASLELLVKLNILSKNGWKEIVDHKFHSKNEEQLIEIFNKGTLKTIPFWKGKKFIEDNCIIDQDDKYLLDKFQNYRNSIMHLGVIDPDYDIKHELFWFIVRIIHQLSWQDALELRHQYLSNSMKELVGFELYEKMLKESAYIDEAVDRAYDITDDIVRHCLECGNETWIETDNEYLLCLACGFRGDNQTFGFIDCPSCNSSSSLVYDPLNIDHNIFLDGKCCTCGDIIPVRKCKICGLVKVFKEKDDLTSELCCMDQ